MRIQITARHCEITDAVRERARSQMDRLTRYDPRVSAAEVIFDEEKHTRKVEAILTVHGDQPVVAKGEDRDFRNALDKVVDRLAKQLRRNRAQVVDHHGPGPVEGPLAEE